MFNSIFPSSDALSITLTATEVLHCSIASVLLGAFIAFIYTRITATSRGFAISLVILPIIVQSVIMTVNGNLGYGVAVLGAFSLIRFRSVAGTSREICAIFLCMAVGLINAMGSIGYAIALAVVVCALMLILNAVGFGDKSGGGAKSLNITIPENLDYNGVFDDIFEKYTKTHRLEKVKTTNLGSLFELHFTVELKNTADEKAFIDELRCRNGNLTIVLSRKAKNTDEL